MNTEFDTIPGPGHPAEEARIRATAWALGELDPEQTAAFEQEMATSPELAEYARNMKGFSSLVAAEYPALDDAEHTSLPEASRSRIVAALSGKPAPSTVVRRSFAARHWQALTLTAAAAALVIVFKPLGHLNLSDSNPLRDHHSNAKAGPGIWIPAIAVQESIATGLAEEIPPPAPRMATISPAMPKPLFVGTPLPQDAAPPNLDRSNIPTLSFQVPEGTTLISHGKPVTSNDTAPIGELSLVTDGDKQGDDGYFVDLMPGKTWIQIDLGSSHDIQLLWIWHFHKQNVIFNDVIVQISDDPAFATSTMVFNNDYDNSSGMGVGKDPSWIETNNGRPIPVNGVKGRYVRLWSNGRDLDDTNQYIEVEVYGRPSSEALPQLAAAIPAFAPVPLLPEAAKPASGAALAVAGEDRLLSAAGGKDKATTISPAMPKPLFVGTPLPIGGRVLAGSLADSYFRHPDLAGVGADGTGYLPPATAGVDPASADSYQNLPVNPFQDVAQVPLSTFSIDVDTASYSIVRRFLNQGQAPPPAAVRLEEIVNYFPYEEPAPAEGKPFGVRVEVTVPPWNPEHRLARVALKGKEVAAAQRPASNLVFLVDVSGSMTDSNKLPLVQQSLRLLTEQLTENDHVSLVTYAGSSGVVLPSTNGQDKTRILAAIDALQSGGSTNGAGGITTAYAQAAQHFLKDGVNRVILATDGDFNVGATSHEALLSLIQDQAKTGVFLSVLGYGMGNLKDDTMELLADKGNGNYAYIDSLSEARKSLVEKMSGTLVTIAKDVKIQIEFNPAAVKSYRLLGYENRLLAKEDFNNDKKDAGEIGAGHNVTALYEIVPVGAPATQPVPVVDGLKYQQTPAVTVPQPEVTPAALTGELMTVKLRWKQPQADTSELMEIPVPGTITPLDKTGQETRWSIAAAGFAQLLRGNAPSALTWESVRQLARGAKGADPFGYRGEFLQLIDKAEGLKPPAK